MAWKWERKRVSAEALAGFFRRLQAMVAAGIPLHQALRFLTSEPDPALRQALDQLVNEVHSGSQLSRAMRSNPVFPAISVDLIAAGETSGRLDYVLENLAQYLERTVRIQKKIIAALVYPAMLFVMTLVVVFVLLVFVFPQEQEMARELGADVPAITQWLAAVTGMLANPAFLFLGAVSAVGGWLAWDRWGRARYGDRVKGFTDQYVLRLPAIGPVLAKSAYARMLGGMVTLIEAGMTVGRSMTVVGALSGNRMLERRFEEFVAAVTDGEPMGEAARMTFPPMVCAMFRIGEEQGQLDRLLRRVAELYEDDVESSLVTMTALLEPMMLMFMGVVVGFVVVATSLPTLQLMQRL